MTRIPELQRILIDGANRQSRAARRPRRWLARRPLAVVVGVLLVGGSAAAAVISLTASRPLSGTLPAGLAPVDTPGRTQYRVSVFPYLTVGWSGWCSSAVFTAHRHQTAVAYDCGPVENSSPIVAAGGPFGGHGSFYEYEIVTSRVAAAHYSNGATITPVSSPRLPAGTRAVVYIGRPKFVKVRHVELPLFPRETLLDAHGHVIPAPVATKSTNVEHLPLTTLNPTDPQGGGCTVHARPVPGLVALTQTVAALVRWPRRQPGAFLACANATYRLGRTTLAVAVLVNATNPAQTAAQLPGLADDPEHPGVQVGNDLGSIGFPQGLGVAIVTGRGHAFDTPTLLQALNDHDVSARRAGKGWLIAEGGNQTQRAILLAALTTGA